MPSLGRGLQKRILLSTLIIVILSLVSNTTGVTAASAHAVSGQATPLRSSAGTLTPSHPSAITASGGNFIIVNYNSDKCLDVANYGTSNLDNVQQWTCHSPSTQNQLWSAHYVTSWTDPNTGVTYDVVQFIEQGTNECLEAYNWGTSDGTNVDIYNCAPASQMHENQLWIIETDQTYTYEYIWNYGATLLRGLGIALDVVCTSGTNNGQNNGANVQLWHETTNSACYGNNQIWVVEGPL
ncbi:MAG TPA: RICIN domain-containing protein [Ktedonobacteraceae bacterium]|jgi:hypothetical protein|nr:RICIN domain-containing protein [Ktedonobacteraceae bacterium]